MNQFEKVVLSKTKDILSQFFTAWQNEDCDAMGEVCQPSWKEFAKKTRMICWHCEHFDYSKMTKKAVVETKINDEQNNRIKNEIGFAQCLLLNLEKSEIQSCGKFKYRNGPLDSYINERLIEWFGEKKLTAFHLYGGTDLTYQTNKDLEKAKQTIRFEAIYRVKTTIEYMLNNQKYKAKVFVNVISEDGKLYMNPSTVLREQNRMKVL